LRIERVGVEVKLRSLENPMPYLGASEVMTHEEALYEVMYLYNSA